MNRNAQMEQLVAASIKRNEELYAPFATTQENYNNNVDSEYEKLDPSFAATQEYYNNVDMDALTLELEKQLTPVVEGVSNLSPEEFRESLQAIVKAEETTVNGEPRTFANSFGEVGVGTVFDGTTHRPFIDKKDTVNKDLPTIGYGHKMTREEYESGLININGKSYSWEAGLSDEAASALKLQDWKVKKRAIAHKYNTKVPTEYKTQYNEFSELPEQYQDILTELAFSIGEGKLGKWEHIYKALNNHDKESIITNVFRVVGEYGKDNPHKRVKNIQAFLRKVLKD